MRGGADNPGRVRPGRRGFTVIELVVVIAAIFLLMALLMVAVHHAIGFTRSSSDRAAVAGLKQGVEQFKQAFGFPPPLVKDGIPPTFPGQGPISNFKPVVYQLSNNPDVTRLSGVYPIFIPDPPAPPPPPPNGTDPRFSIYALSYYVLGALDKNVDGQDGPGFCAVKRDGSFEKSGRKFGPFFDPRRGDAVYEEHVSGTDGPAGRIQLRDSHGVAFRYYFWLSTLTAMGTLSNTPTTDDLRIPELVGDPTKNPDLRNAEYAIVGAGPNGLFGDEDLLPAAHPQHLTLDQMGSKVGITYDNTPAGADKIRKACAADNIVEVGR
jgi:type II secretory pathway pseudopilin PulG